MIERPVPGDRRIRLALVGCGRISRNHFEAIAKLPELELVAVCDVVPERAREAGEAQGVPWFTDYEALLATVPSDAVVLCRKSRTGAVKECMTLS